MGQGNSGFSGRIFRTIPSAIPQFPQLRNSPRHFLPSTPRNFPPPLPFPAIQPENKRLVFAPVAYGSHCGAPYRRFRFPADPEFTTSDTMSKKNNNGVTTPNVNLGNGRIPAPSKEDLVQKLSMALNGVNAATKALAKAEALVVTKRQNVVPVIQEMARSGHWTTEALRALVIGLYEGAGMTKQAAYRNLILAGVREYEERKADKRGGKPRKPRAATPENDDEESEESDDEAPTIPTDPTALATAIVAAVGKEKAIGILSQAYLLASMAK